MNIVNPPSNEYEARIVRLERIVITLAIGLVFTSLAVLGLLVRVAR